MKSIIALVLAITFSGNLAKAGCAESNICCLEAILPCPIDEAATCYCDISCLGYNDCCSDFLDYCNIAGTKILNIPNYLMSFSTF